MHAETDRHKLKQSLSFSHTHTLARARQFSLAGAHIMTIIVVGLSHVFLMFIIIAIYCIEADDGTKQSSCTYGWQMSPVAYIHIHIQYVM